MPPRTRASIHGEVDLPENWQKDLTASRKPGEASTYKESPGSAMESSSGSYSKSPNGLHHWKYGKCNFCQQAEGKLVKGAGVLANPGGAAGVQGWWQVYVQVLKVHKVWQEGILTSAWRRLDYSLKIHLLSSWW